MTLIAEDLFLLLLDDEKGTLGGTSYPQPVLGGAVLIELATTGAVEVEEKTSVWRSAKVHPAGHPPEDAVLRAAYDVVAEKPRSAQDLVTRIGKGVRDTLAERLVQRGILERRESRVLGLFPRTRWPAVDSRHEAELRTRLTGVLVRGDEPDERTGALVALLAAIDRAQKVVDHQGLPAKEVRQRATAIAEGAWAAKAVRDAILAASSAVTAAVTASTVAVTTSG
ncbi:MULTISPECIES: GOLPH3/VPS74 family protein [unclassified Nocardioides]|uniref:GOLPH3/VPS74 family protein n=1 Tax=unclassified Nocardioides TaxID=2615069 RepID=UPI0030157F40